MSSVDVQLISWNQEEYKDNSVSSGISSNIVSCTLVDDEGKEIEIKEVGKDPIEIKISSPYITSSSTCKYFDVLEQEWKEVGVKERKIGKSITCATTHLTDFAAFEANEGQGHFEWDKNLLWLLMILLVFPVGGVLIAGVILLSRAIKKQKLTLVKKKQYDAAMKKEFENIV